MLTMVLPRELKLEVELIHHLTGDPVQVTAPQTCAIHLEEIPSQPGKEKMSRVTPCPPKGGRTLIGGLGPGQYSLTPRVTGFLMLPTQDTPPGTPAGALMVQLGEGSPDPLPVSIRLLPAGGLAGTVLDHRDQPVPRALITVSTQGEDRDLPPVTTRSNSRGLFKLEGLMEGIAAIRVEKEGFQPTHQREPVTAGTVYDDILIYLSP